jgi:SNF2 family DNA or RNA helicase
LALNKKMSARRRRSVRQRESKFRNDLHGNDGAAATMDVVEQDFTVAHAPVLADEGRSIALRYRLDSAARARFLAFQPLCDLYPHQRSGADFILHRMFGELEPRDVLGGGLLDDMRMGKSRSITSACLRYIQRRVAAGGERFGEPIIIFAPKDLLATWKAEIEEVVGRDTLAVVTLETDALQHEYPFADERDWLLEKLRDETDIILASHSLVTSSGHFAAAILKEQLTYSALFCDEAHEYINPNTQSNDVIGRLSARSKWYVSGTPIQNTLDSLRNALCFTGVSVERLDALDGTDALVHLAQQVSIRRTFNPVAIIPVTSLDFSSLREREMYTSLQAQLLAALSARDKQQGVRPMDKLRTIHLLRNFCISPYMCQHFFDNETFCLPESVLLAPASLIGNSRRDAPEEDNDENDPMDISVEASSGVEESTLEGPSPIARLPTHDTYDELLMSLVLREMTLEAIGADPAFARQGMNLDEHPLVLAHLHSKAVALRARLVPLVGPKERWVCQTLLSGDTDRTREKVIIFSNSRAALQRLARLFNLRLLAGVPGARKYVYIDGLLDLEERRRARRHFDNDPDIGVCLAMIKVNSRGLDMTSANHAVLYDPWWNPNPEHQAVSRVRGPRQTRPVHVYRLALRDTIETFITTEADSKVQLDQYALPQTVLTQQSDAPIELSPVAAPEQGTDQDAILRVMELLSAYNPDVG